MPTSKQNLGILPASPILLGFRPRRPVRPAPDFGVAGVRMIASVSDCLADPVIPAVPDWENMNVALHYETVAGAVEAARRAGADRFEVHAARLRPVLFKAGGPGPLRLDLRRLDGPASEPEEIDGWESLGFDVACVSEAAFKDGICDYLPFDCSPLSCNRMAVEYPVNEWCLLSGPDEAATAAGDFAKDPPEPGPFVIVEVLRCLSVESGRT